LEAQTQSVGGIRIGPRSDRRHFAYHTTLEFPCQQ
jgi:hypothetical protein